MRKHYLDNIRWIVVCIVVIYHVIYMFNGVQLFGVIGPFHERQYQDAFLYLVYPWFMVILFVVSGMSANFYLANHSTKEFRKNKNDKLLVPSTLGLLAFQWTTGYYNTAISHAFDGEMAAVPGFVKGIICILSGIGPLWYIQTLWVLSMVLLLVRKVEKGRLCELGSRTNVLVMILFAIPVFGAAQILNTPIVTVYRFGIYGLSFFLGYYVFSQEEVMERLTKWWCPLGIAAVVLGIAYTVLYFGENYAAEPVINNVLACTYAWIAVLAILANAKKWLDFDNGFTAWMNRKSWGLYVFHYLPLAMAAFYLNAYMSDMAPVLYYLLAGIAAFVGAYLLNEIISRIPVLRYLVLGIRKDSAKNV